MDTVAAFEMLLLSARAGSFSGAARRLGITPAAVSKQVGRLERELGAQLVSRTTRSLALTEAGKRLVAAGEPALSALRAAMSEAQPRDREIAGVLRVSLPAAFGREYVLPAIGPFLAAHPALKLDWRFENRQADLVADALDAGIAGGLELVGSVVARSLAPLHLVLVAAPSYLRKAPDLRRPADLVKHDAVILRSTSTRRSRPWRLQLRDTRITVETKPRLWLDEPEAVASAALLGYGVALVGLPHVARHLQSGALVRVLPQWWADAGAISVYFPRGRPVPAKTRAFVDHLLQAFAQPELQQLLRADR